MSAETALLLASAATAGGILMIAGTLGAFAVRRATRRTALVARVVFVPPPPFDARLVVRGMISEALRCGSSEYQDHDRKMSIRECPELDEPWRAVYQSGVPTFHPTCQEAGEALAARALAGIETARRRQVGEQREQREQVRR